MLLEQESVGLLSEDFKVKSARDPSLSLRLRRDRETDSFD